MSITLPLSSADDQPIRFESSYGEPDRRVTARRKYHRLAVVQAQVEILEAYAEAKQALRAFTQDGDETMARAMTAVIMQLMQEAE